MRTAQDLAGPVSVSPTEGASRVPRRVILIKKIEYANFKLENMCNDIMAISVSLWEYRALGR
jgi:hypothetical protein